MRSFAGGVKGCQGKTEGEGWSVVDFIEILWQHEISRDLFGSLVWISEG
jgi:hypothetical protein